MKLVQKTIMKPEWTSCKSQAGGTDCRGPGQSILLGQTWTLNDSITIGPFSQQHRPPIFLSSYHSRRKKWAARAFCSVSPLARPDGPPPNLLSVDLYHFSYLYFSIYLYLYYVVYTTPSTTTHNESLTPGTIIEERCKELSTLVVE